MSLLNMKMNNFYHFLSLVLSKSIPLLPCTNSHINYERCIEHLRPMIITVSKPSHSPNRKPPCDQQDTSHILALVLMLYVCPSSLFKSLFTSSILIIPSILILYLSQIPLFFFLFPSFLSFSSSWSLSQPPFRPLLRPPCPPTSQTDSLINLLLSSIFLSYLPFFLFIFMFFLRRFLQTCIFLLNLVL